MFTVLGAILLGFLDGEAALVSLSGAVGGCRCT